jgi:glycosyltransferase involved in cell wall biosynthesis
MKITIDVQPVFGRKSGVGQYIWGLIQGLGEIDRQNTYSLSFFDFKRRGFMLPLPGNNFSHQKCFLPGRMASLLWKTFAWPSYNFFFGESDIFHFPNFIIRPVKRAKKIVTIHDVSFLRFPEFAEPKNLKFLKKEIRKTVEEADHIIADSYFTEAELTYFFPAAKQKISTVHLGIDARFKPMPVKRDKNILFVGNIEPRKNLPGLFKAFEILKDRHPELHDFKLTIAGMKGWLYEGIFEAWRHNKHKDQIHFLDYVSDEQLPELYAKASVFVYPSFYEGFGLPPLEAMACGTPVISAKKASLPEVLGDAAVWIDPDEPESISTALKDVLLNEEKNRNLIDKGLLQSSKFQWSRTAAETVKIYNRCLA